MLDNLIEYAIPLAIRAHLAVNLEPGVAITAKHFEDAIAAFNSERENGPLNAGNGFIYADILGPQAGRFAVTIHDRRTGDDSKCDLGPDDNRPEDFARLAVDHLRAARDLLVLAGASRAVDRVRAAITSAGGAVRHAQGKAGRSDVPVARAEG